MQDRIAKQRFNVILLVDTSTSMRGKRIEQVNKALRDIKARLIEMESENANVDFYISIVTFSTDAKLYNNQLMERIDDLDFQDIKAGGWSNLHLALIKLEDLLKKEKNGGIMPDFGGIAPVILLLTDGHPTGTDYKAPLEELKGMAWFKAALRYGIAIELNDQRTTDVLRDFVGKNGDVIQCYDAKLLEKIIKVIVLTSSAVKSSSADVSTSSANKGSINQLAQKKISQNLAEEEWEW